MCYIYLPSPRHLHFLEVSLYSLRKHYQGDVAILTTVPDDVKRFGEQVKFVNKPDALGAPAYMLKSQVPVLSPFDSTAFLDADTIVDGSIETLFPIADEVVVTRHCQEAGIVTEHNGALRVDHAIETGHLSRATVNRLKQQKHDGFDLPSINTGVFGCAKGCKVQPEWERLTKHFWDFDLHDEIALQLCYWKYQYRVVPAWYNVIPIVTSARNAARAVIWHVMKGNYGLGHAAELHRQYRLEMWNTGWAGCVPPPGFDRGALEL